MDILKISNFYVATSVQDAYDMLIKSRANSVLGGAMWLRQSRKPINTIIDLSKLGLDYIKEDENYIYIGAMATLNDIASSELLQTYYGSLFTDMTYHIVGTQFRNTATVGGSVFGRYGFSDILTGFLAIKAVVKTVKHGEMPIEEFSEKPYEKDLLEYVKIDKKQTKVSYKSFRNQATDFPVLTVCVAKYDDVLNISVGARPKKAELVHSKEDALKLSFGANMRGSAEYRRALCDTLIDDALLEV